MRGVHGAEKFSRFPSLGSSPHARGPPNLEIPSGLTVRIIPACAGSTNGLLLTQEVAEDHPRMRGVHQFGKFLVRPDKGSSPHARGPRQEKWSTILLLWIIPACAGSTRTDW